MAGRAVRGWRTLAPKYDISHASWYVIPGRQTASGTFLGSALYTPSTSVQMVMWLDRRRDPMMVAEKSDPFLRRVVACPWGFLAMNPVAMTSFLGPCFLNHSSSCSGADRKEREG